MSPRQYVDLFVTVAQLGFLDAVERRPSSFDRVLRMLEVEKIRDDQEDDLRTAYESTWKHTWRRVIITVEATVVPNETALVVYRGNDQFEFLHVLDDGRPDLHQMDAGKEERT